MRAYQEFHDCASDFTTRCVVIKIHISVAFILKPISQIIKKHK